MFEEQLAKVDVAQLKPSFTLENSQLDIVCGPLLRYWGLEDGGTKWSGSVIYVTRDTNSTYEPFPEFLLQQKAVDGPYKYWSQDGVSWWRFDLLVLLHPESSTYLTYELSGEHPPFKFWVPGQNETMRTMFHTCNGFSLGVETAKFPGSLWSDVLRNHDKKPFHVMLGGGDQIYCDGVKTVVPDHLLQPIRRHNRYSSEEAIKSASKVLNHYYLTAYAQWFGKGKWTGLNGSTHQPDLPKALGSIPQLNVWDDHDIIDGFGSYTHFLQRDKFWKMIGSVAYKFYMLFQQGTAPDGDDPKLKSGFVNSGKGCYIDQPARSIYAQLGRSAAFYGLDCRMERTRHQICSDETYHAMFAKLSEEFRKNPHIEHLYVMLGVPIAYPRMVWAESLMSSWIASPLKWLAQHRIILKGFVNDFNGEVELLDDLDDHWCARHHKEERNLFLRQLASLAEKFSVRVTILSGDVHLTGVGRFRTPGKSPESDPWLMVCPISSAITNTPPPTLLGDFMNKRNKLHHLPPAVEDMVPLFSVDVDGSKRHNVHMLTRRNYCILDYETEETNDPVYPGPEFAPKSTTDKMDSEAMPALAGSVRVTIQAEADMTLKTAETRAYELLVPPLHLNHARD